MTAVKLILDADILLYRASASSEEDFGDGNPVASFSAARDAFERGVEAWTRFNGAKSWRLAVSDKSNFRRGIADYYKSNRKDKPKPIILDRLREWALENYKCIQLPGLEADDVIGICMTRPGGRCVGVTIDKDLNGVPGVLWNPDKGDFPVEISEDEANLFWMRQTLIGDPSDGYKGIPGIGVKRAEKILPREAPVEELWRAVSAAYNKAGIGDLALINARLARILRHGEYDEATGKVKLWEPA